MSDLADPFAVLLGAGRGAEQCERADDSAFFAAGGQIRELYEWAGGRSDERSRVVCYLLDGRAHRDDGPALIFHDEAGRRVIEAWYEHGSPQRAGAPQQVHYFSDGQPKVEVFREPGAPERVIDARSERPGIVSVLPGSLGWQLCDADGAPLAEGAISALDGQVKEGWKGFAARAEAQLAEAGITRLDDWQNDGWRTISCSVRFSDQVCESARVLADMRFAAVGVVDLLGKHLAKRLAQMDAAQEGERRERERRAGAHQKAKTMRVSARSSDRTRIAVAFAALRAQGLAAEEDYECCHSCGCARMADEHGADTPGVFFHHQCADAFRVDGDARMTANLHAPLYLYWQGQDTPALTIGALAAVGLTVEHDGRPDSALIVQPRPRG